MSWLQVTLVPSFVAQTKISFSNPCPKLISNSNIYSLLVPINIQSHSNSSTPNQTQTPTQSLSPILSSLIQPLSHYNTITPICQSPRLKLIASHNFAFNSEGFQLVVDFTNLPPIRTTIVQLQDITIQQQCEINKTKKKRVQCHLPKSLLVIHKLFNIAIVVKLCLQKSMFVFNMVYGYWF